jgi:hypothetical protein
MLKLSLFLSAERGPIPKSPKRATGKWMRFLQSFSSPLGVLEDLKSPNLLGALHLLRYPTGLLSLKIPELPHKSQIHHCDEIDSRFSPFSGLALRYGTDDSQPSTL